MIARRPAEAARVRSPHPRIRIRYTRAHQRELELEAFDPSPPAPGTVLLTRFAFGSARLSALHRRIINQVAQQVIVAMRGLPALHCLFIEIEGHEDEVGDPVRFGRLGEARASAVTRALADRLAALIRRLPAAQQRDVQISVSSAGPTRPIRSNVTPDGRALNRRVEIRGRLGPCGTIA
jgi:outer membrane protein OmpA-like peptidoglycan-associated protein